MLTETVIASSVALAATDILKLFGGLTGSKGENSAKKIVELNSTKLPPVVVTGRGKNLKIQQPSKRLSWGITKEDGKYKAAILVERDKGAAYNEALKIKNDYPDSITYKVVGKAQSSNPHALGKRTPMISGLHPGTSVGHLRGYPGTLGCLVKSKKQSEKWIGFTSASHVLSMNNKASKNDIVIMPGHPDGPKSTDSKVGLLKRFIYLTHYLSELDEPSSNILNCTDVALVKIEPEDEAIKIPETNKLVDPNDVSKKIVLRGFLDREKTIDYIGETVFKVGRSSDFTSGVLDVVGLMSQSMELPDGKLYIYTNVLTVEWIDRKPFSIDGDSGALVYTKDGFALGFIIGASEGQSFVSPIQECLTDIRAELI